MKTENNKLDWYKKLKDDIRPMLAEIKKEEIKERTEIINLMVRALTENIKPTKRISNCFIKKIFQDWGREMNYFNPPISVKEIKLEIDKKRLGIN